MSACCASWWLCFRVAARDCRWRSLNAQKSFLRIHNWSASNSVSEMAPGTPQTRAHVPFCLSQVGKPWLDFSWRVWQGEARPGCPVSSSSSLSVPVTLGWLWWSPRPGLFQAAHLQFTFGQWEREEREEDSLGGFHPLLCKVGKEGCLSLNSVLLGQVEHWSLSLDDS